MPDELMGYCPSCKVGEVYSYEDATNDDEGECANCGEQCTNADVLHAPGRPNYHDFAEMDDDDDWDDEPPPKPKLQDGEFYGYCPACFGKVYEIGDELGQCECCGQEVDKYEVYEENRRSDVVVNRLLFGRK